MARHPAERASITVADDVLGRIAVRDAAGDRAIRLIDVGGRPYGAIDLESPQRLHLPYLRVLRALVEALLPAGRCRVVHLGGGACALARALAARRPEVRQVVAETSAAMIALAVDELGLRPSPQLGVRHDDGRHVVETLPTGSVDLVVGDAFVGRKVPRHLATTEFVAEIARVLGPRGTYVLNLIDGPPWSTSGAHAATIHTALPHLLAAGSPASAALTDVGNLFLVASRWPLHHASLQWRLRQQTEPVQITPAAGLAALLDASRPRRDNDG